MYQAYFTVFATKQLDTHGNAVPPARRVYPDPLRYDGHFELVLEDGVAVRVTFEHLRKVKNGL